VSQPPSSQIPSSSIPSSSILPPPTTKEKERSKAQASSNVFDFFNTPLISDSDMVGRRELAPEKEEIGVQPPLDADISSSVVNLVSLNPSIVTMGPEKKADSHHKEATDTESTLSALDREMIEFKAKSMRELEEEEAMKQKNEAEERKERERREEEEGKM
ncbi:hypothetical protein ADUPG1_004988, partial [Aduncisulcus paluster]